MVTALVGAGRGTGRGTAVAKVAEEEFSVVNRLMLGGGLHY